MSEKKADEGAPRAKRHRRMTDKGMQFEKSLHTEKVDPIILEEPADKDPAEETPPARDTELEPVGDSNNIVPDGHQQIETQTESSHSTAEMAMMARWFSEMSGIMAEMRQMKQDFQQHVSEFRAATDFQQQQPSQPPQQPTPSTSTQQPQQSEGDQSSSRHGKGFVSRYAINRNLVRVEKVPCNPPKMVGKNADMDASDLLPVVSDLDVHRAMGSGRANTVCNMAKSRDSLDTAGNRQQGTNVTEHGVEEHATHTDLNVSVAGTQSQEQLNVPLIPTHVKATVVNPPTMVPACQVMSTGSTPGSSTNQLVYPPPERHTTVTSVQPQAAQQQWQAPPVEAMAATIQQFQATGVPDVSPEELVPVAADGLQVVMKSQVELQKMLTECMLVGEGVEERMIKKIWSGQFVEFPELLNGEEGGIYDVTYTQDESAKQMSLTQRPKKEITTYDEWLRAWETYHVIYLKHPANNIKHQQMVTYAKNIRQFREQGYNWIQYDRKFRHQRLSFGTSIPPWGCIRQDLWNDMVTERQLRGPFREPGAQQEKSSGQFRKQGKSGGSFNPGYIPKSYCYGYHLPGRTCESGAECTFNHECPKCSKEHPAHTCGEKPQRKRGKGNGAKNASAGKKPNSNSN